LGGSKKQDALGCCERKGRKSTEDNSEVGLGGGTTAAQEKGANFEEKGGDTVQRKGKRGWEGRR